MSEEDRRRVANYKPGALVGGLAVGPGVGTGVGAWVGPAVGITDIHMSIVLFNLYLCYIVLFCFVFGF